MRFLVSCVVLIASSIGAAPYASASTRPASELAAPHAQAAVSGRGAFIRQLVRSLAFDAGLGGNDSLLRSADGDTDGDDDTVVQDEAPAARIDAGDGVTPALEPLGTLVSSPYTLPAARILPRRSPRGPPVF